MVIEPALDPGDFAPHFCLPRDEFTSAGDNVEVIGMCIQMEAEAATIADPIERAEML